MHLHLTSVGFQDYCWSMNQSLLMLANLLLLSQWQQTVVCSFRDKCSFRLSASGSENSCTFILSTFKYFREDKEKVHGVTTKTGNRFVCGWGQHTLIHSQRFTNFARVVLVFHRREYDVKKSLFLVGWTFYYNFRLYLSVYPHCPAQTSSLSYIWLIVCCYFVSLMLSWSSYSSSFLLPASRRKTSIRFWMAQLFFLLFSSWVPDEKIDPILWTVRAVTRKRRAELTHR